MPNTSIDGFSVLSPSQKKELERQRQEKEAQEAARKAEAKRKSQEASQRAKEAEEKRKAEEARRKAEKEEKEQRRRALIVFLYILLITIVIAWIFVSFHYFNWLSEKDDWALTQIIEGAINMLWTGIVFLPFIILLLGKISDKGGLPF